MVVNDLNKNVPRLSIERGKRLWSLYSLLLQLVMHEGRFVSERTNNFLVWNSIFFAGFLFLATQLSDRSVWTLALKLAVPTLGIAMSIFQYIVIRHTLDAAHFWRDRLRQIEADADFWYPDKVRGDKDLDIIEARHKAAKEARYAHPNAIYGYWLPVFLGILWSLAFFWGVIDYLAKTN